MKKISSILLLCFIFSMGKAQETTVHSNYDETADFSNYKTFTIIDHDDPTAQWNEGEITGTDAQRQRTTGATGEDQGNTITETEGTTTQGTTGIQDQERSHGQDQESSARAEKGAHGTRDKEMKKRLMKAFKSEMEKQGFTYSGKDDADLLIDFNVFEESGTVNLGANTYTYIWGPHLGDRTQTVNIEEGTVLVSMIDSEHGQLIYQAYIKMEDEGKREEKVDEAVSQIFDDFNSIRQ